MWFRKELPGIWNKCNNIADLLVTKCLLSYDFLQKRKSIKCCELFIEINIDSGPDRVPILESTQLCNEL